MGRPAPIDYKVEIKGHCPECGRPMRVNYIPKAQWRGDPEAVTAGSRGLCVMCYGRWQRAQPGYTPPKNKNNKAKRNTPSGPPEGDVTDEHLAVLRHAVVRMSLSSLREIAHMLGIPV